MSPQLLALLTSVCYATALVSARRGLRYSPPATVTCFSVVVQVVTLWTAVFLKETRRQGDKETRRQGDKETRRQGDKETRRDGELEEEKVDSGIHRE